MTSNLGGTTALATVSRTSKTDPSIAINLSLFKKASGVSIDQLQSCIDSLRQNWVDLYDSVKEKK
jgi:hypothetical protein